jgi:hypothetical protein
MPQLAGPYWAHTVYAGWQQADTGHAARGALDGGSLQGARTVTSVQPPTLQLLPLDQGHSGAVRTPNSNPAVQQNRSSTTGLDRLFAYKEVHTNGLITLRVLSSVAAATSTARLEAEKNEMVRTLLLQQRLRQSGKPFIEATLRALFVYRHAPSQC